MTVWNRLRRLVVAERREFFLVEGVAFGLLATGVVLSMTASFVALRAMAELAGQPRGLSWIWPLIIDGAIILATAALIVLMRHARQPAVQVPWSAHAYFWSLLVASEAISITGNAVHAAISPTRVLDAWFAATIAALAPLGSLAYVHGFGVLVRIRTTTAVSVAEPTVPASVTAADTLRGADVSTPLPPWLQPDVLTAAETGQGTPAMAAADTVTEQLATPVANTDTTTAHGDTASGDAVNDSDGGADTRRVAARRLHAQGWTHAQIAAELRVSKRTVRRYLSTPPTDTAPEHPAGLLPTETTAEVGGGVETNHHQPLKGVLT
ncbi:helix-turn-helix domain-containing protein [Nocardia arthritidis]|uniref:DUF2637 domain-containing protein n=1 Tax=Nocardia arthritidis TaxID=228602 RepID=A0A6G9YC65_9NOCA|nr:helix-turn-helix domain-containing protein [Nocardia arthritidis]QIS10754.1 DUF2637 domain-containing protein [Nocardia arthritidis]